MDVLLPTCNSLQPSIVEVSRGMPPEIFSHFVTSPPERYGQVSGIKPTGGNQRSRPKGTRYASENIFPFRDKPA